MSIMVYFVLSGMLIALPIYGFGEKNVPVSIRHKRKCQKILYLYFCVAYAAAAMLGSRGRQLTTLGDGR